MFRAVFCGKSRYKLYYRYRIIQIRPLQPSLMIRSMVSCSLMRASPGIRLSLLCSPSLTSSCRLLPKMFDCQIFSGESSNSLSRYMTRSSDCFSLPTMGATSVVMSARIRCVVYNKQKFFYLVFSLLQRAFRPEPL